MAVLDLPTLFEQGFQEKHAREAADHVEPSKDEDGVVRWHWYASSLAGCVRAAVLKRAGQGHDPTTLNSSITFAFGHTMHSLCEEFLQGEAASVLGTGVEVVTVENKRYRYYEDTGVVAVEPWTSAHATLPLKARPDAIFRLATGQYAVFDLKTESAFSNRMRKAEAKSAKLSHSVRAEHQLQITAGAMVAESKGIVPFPVEYGIATYVAKAEGRNEWLWDTQLFEIGSGQRASVLRAVEALDEAWTVYERDGILPDRLPNEFRSKNEVLNWRCKPIDASNPSGRYCEARSTCFLLPPTPRVIV